MSIELHEYISEDEKFIAIVFLEEKGIFTVVTSMNDNVKEIRHFHNESMAQYWADDCVVDYDLTDVADRGKE